MRAVLCWLPTVPENSLKHIKFTDTDLVLEAVVEPSQNLCDAGKCASFLAVGAVFTVHLPALSANMASYNPCVGPLLRDNDARTEGSTRSAVSAAFLCSRKTKRFLLLFPPFWSRFAQAFSFHCLSGR